MCPRRGVNSHRRYCRCEIEIDGRHRDLVRNRIRIHFGHKEQVPRWGPAVVDFANRVQK